MKQALFTLDALGTQAFEGYTRGESWNGWSCPYFTFERAQAVVEAWQGQGWAASFDEAAGLFTFAVGHDMDTGEAEAHESFGSLQIEGRTLYPIGASSWMWEETEPLESQSISDCRV
jgi:hypothetical protein